MVNLIGYANSTHDLRLWSKLGCKEIVLTPESLCSMGKGSFEEIKSVVEFMQNKKMEPILLWDILINESEMVDQLSELGKYLALGIRIVRVKDVGAIYYLKNCSDVQIDLIQGNANQNLEAMQFWKEYLGTRLRKVVLSKEVSREFIKTLTEEKISLEICLLGKILLSHSKRKLLSNYLKSPDNALVVQCLEGASERFTFIQNEHGTMSFHSQGFSMIDHWDDLIQMGIKNFTIENHLLVNDDWIAQLMEALINDKKEVVSKLLKQESARWTDGLYQFGDTEKIFSKLKNKYLKNCDTSHVGEVIDVKNGHYLGIDLNDRGRLTKDSKLILKTPDGKIKTIKLNFFKNSRWQDISSSEGERLVYINYISGITFKTQVFFHSEEN